jgi:hydroxyacylglutathione hydrolase
MLNCIHPPSLVIIALDQGEKMFKIIPIPAFYDNYIWLIVNDQNQAIVIDPGDATPVLKYLTKNNLTLTNILITHHHADHTGGVEALTKHTDATIHAPKISALQHCDHPVSDGDTVTIESHQVTFTVMATPGHTLDHICYYTPGHVFCGDTLFAGGCGRIFEGDADMMYQSLQKISALPSDTLIYCAHEYTQQNLAFARLVEPNNQDLLKRIAETNKLRQLQQPTLPCTMELEHATNPFLRCQYNDVKQAATRFSGQEIASESTVFAIIRQWKDTL